MIVLKFHCATPLGLCASRMGQRGKNFLLHFYAFHSILSGLIHIFLVNIFMSAKRKTCATEASRMQACWSDLLYQSFIKNHFELSYCSFEIVYAVKDCDPCV